MTAVAHAPTKSDLHKRECSAIATRFLGFAASVLGPNWR